MATGAIVNDSGMVKVRGAPGDCCVAIIAGIATGHVRWVFSGCDNAVMAAVAGTDNLSVVHSKDRRKNICCMAVFTYVA